MIEICGPRVPQAQLSTTGITRWASHTRPLLFDVIAYATQPASVMSRTSSVLKIKDARLESAMLEKLYSNAPIAKYRLGSEADEAA